MSAVEVPPYSRLAPVWDVLQGNRMLPLFLRNLHVLTSRHRMRFRRVADVGCGSGSFVLALRRQGIHATGVDRSSRMVALARRQSLHARSSARRACVWALRAAGPRPAGPPHPGGDEGFHRQDLRTLRLDRPVDLITCNFDVLNYLGSERELTRAFRAFAANLVPGGHLLFDVIVAAPAVSSPRRRVHRLRVRGLETVWVVDRLPGGLRRVVLWIRGPGSRRRWRRELHVQRAHPAERVLRALRRAGLRPLAVYDARTLGPPRRGCPRNVFVARRPRAGRPLSTGGAP